MARGDECRNPTSGRGPRGVLQRLRAVRPPDPAEGAAQRAAVRVLARLAVREAGWMARRPDRTRRVLAAAAAAVLAGLLFLQPGGRGVRDSLRAGAAQTASGTAQAAWAPAVDAALAGDGIERMRVVRGGGGARGALLAVAEAGGPRAAQALRLLDTAGTLTDEDRIARLAALASRALLRRDVLELLSRRAGAEGLAALGRLLAAGPRAGADVVAALRRAARRGRRAAAFEALLAGAAAGDPQAAGAALTVGGAPGALRVLAVTPAGELGEPAVVAAVRAATPTLRARILRMAERGDERALRLAATAQLPEAIPLLTSRAVAGGPESAAGAALLLAGYEDVRAHVALGRALEGPARERVLALLCRLDDRPADALAERARNSARDAPAALAALAASGEAGVQRVVELAGTGPLARPAVAALAGTQSESAVAALVGLSLRRALVPDAVRALGRHLARGTATAARALLELARRRDDRLVFRVLGASGAPGLAALQEATRDPHLAQRAREALDRLQGPRSATRTVVRAPRGTPRRSPRSI